jgi:uncharacterized protein YndB with AHSA1/START domain
MTTRITYKDGTLTVVRTYAAPREAVFEAWIETSKVQRWWGCADATRVRSEVEPRVGGKYNHAMTIHGSVYAQDARFTEYDPPARLAYASEPGAGGPPQTVTVDFEEVPGGTRVRLVHTGIPEMPVDDRGTMLPDVIRNGWTAGLTKLGDLLAAGG